MKHATLTENWRSPFGETIALLPALPTPVLEALVERIIDTLDARDGDVDLEPEPLECDDPQEAWFQPVVNHLTRGPF